MGPELGEEAEQAEHQQGGEHRVAGQGALVGQLAQALTAEDQAQYHLLVEEGDHHEHGDAQQEVVEDRREAADQPGGGEVTLGAQLVFRHCGLLA
ncbi:hypothetical protein FQZ97_1185720 [compost metagenome]